jgi:hypothetical protein
MNLYSFLQHLHSGFRYIVIALILAAIIGSLVGWIGQKAYTNGNRKLNLFAMISAHTQLLIGIVLYFVSPLVMFDKAVMKNPVGRYFTVEHWVIMLIAIALITIGHSKSKKGIDSEAKHKSIVIFYFLALVIILAGIILIPRS